MLKKTLTLGIGICLGTCLMADFILDFKAATELYNKKSYQEAQEAFVKISDSAATPQAKAECLNYAALSLGKLKKYDEAIELAKKIGLKPYSVNCQMGVMGDNRKYKELVEAFKDEDIGKWPEPLMAEGYNRRAMAYFCLADWANSAKDLEKVLETAGTDPNFVLLTLNTLGDVYSEMKDQQKALETYRKVSSKMTFMYVHYNSVIKSAGILRQQGKLDEALAELKKIDLAKAAGLWKFGALRENAEILEAQGKKSEAVAKYKEALNVKDGIPASYVTAVEKKIGTLSAN